MTTLKIMTALAPTYARELPNPIMRAVIRVLNSPAITALMMRRITVVRG